MAEYVHSGDKIQASQYNALVDAIAGPTNATTDQPFTQTKNGVVINGGLGPQTTKAASTVPAIFEVSYGNGYVGAGYSTYQQGDIDANRFNGVFLNIGSWDTLAYNGFVLANGCIVPTVPAFAIIDPTSINAAVVVYNQALADTAAKGKLPLCTADKDAGYAFVQVVDNGTSGKARNGDFVLLVGDFTKIGGASGSDIKTVSAINIRATIRGINLYESCEDVRVVQGGVLWRHNVIAGVAGSNIPHLSYTVGTQYVDMLPDSYVNVDNAAEGEEVVWSNALMDVKLKSIGVVPPSQMGFSQLQSTNTLELYHFDKLSSDINRLGEINDGELSSYDVLVKHKKPHPYAADDPIYEGQDEADLQYIALSCVVPPGDANANRRGTINTNLSSVSLAAIDGNAFYELYGFDKNGTLTKSDLSSGGIDVVVRDYKTTGGNGARTNYVALSDLAEAISSGNVSIDSQNTALSSIGKDPSNNLELYRFSILGDYTTLTAAQYDDIVIRHRRSDTGGAEVSYVQLSNFLIPPTDTEWYGDQRSIEKPNNEYYQLYNFRRDASIEDRSLRVTLRYDGSTRYFRGDGGSSDTKDPNNKVIVKHYDGNGNIVEYDGLEIVAPKVSAADVDGLGEEIGTIIGGDSNISTILSGQLSNVFWVQGDHGGGTCYGQSIGDGNKNVVVDLNGKTLNDSNGVIVDWGIYGLYDAQNLKVDWGNSGLYKNSTRQTLNWANGILYDPNNGNVALNWDVGYAKDPAGSGCTINWNTGHLWSDDNTRVMNWKLKQLIGDWTANGNFRVTNGSLTIGNTTITEAQLQQLLALLNTP